MFRNGLRFCACLIALASCNAQQTHSILLIEITFDGVCIPEFCQEQDAQIAQGLMMRLAKTASAAAPKRFWLSGISDEIHGH
jgi:hypothetical protein